MTSLLAILERARDFAIWAHGAQKYGEHPYVKHLDDVVGVVREFGGDEAQLVAAYLHDVVEDCKPPIEHPVVDYNGVPGDVVYANRYAMSEVIEWLFGLHVATLVDAVTNEPGVTRSDRHAATYPKLFKAGRRAIFLKLCDRIANMRASIGTDKAQMYVKEYSEFKLVLYTPDNDLLWRECDRLYLALNEAELERR